MTRHRFGLRLRRAFSLVLAIALAPLVAARAEEPRAASGESPSSPGRLEDVRVSMQKWMETQQLISKERKDWQQGKEILAARLDVVKKEVTTLEEEIAKATAKATEAAGQRQALVTENETLTARDARLRETVIVMEREILRIVESLPEPVKQRLEPLHQRIPREGGDGAVRVSTAERFQNVLGILNELNKANNEITVSYEVREMADGKPAEVKVVYVGLAQAYFVSARGEAGIGRPSPSGWTWEPRDAIAGDVARTIEILEGKQSPAFVPLPVSLR